MLFDEVVPSINRAAYQRAAMPRFVLLRHECPPEFGKPSHWDLMLESGSVLRTWDLRLLPTPWARVFGGPDGGVEVSACLLPDHRVAYLDYEGPVTGNRGVVKRCDGGSYERVGDASDSLTVVLAGELLRGIISLTDETLTIVAQH